MKNHYSEARRLFCLLIIVVFSNITISAQAVVPPGEINTDSKVFYPQVVSSHSPEIESTRYDNLSSADLHTGTNSLTIPLFTYKDQDIELPISIQYSSSGYRPNNSTGILGLGWTLNAGGYVVREIRGGPDEVDQFHEDGWPNGYEDSDHPLGNSLKYWGDDYGKTSDIYYFRYPGNSGSFIYDTKSDNPNFATDNNDATDHKLIIKRSQKPFGEISVRDRGVFSYVREAEWSQHANGYNQGDTIYTKTHYWMDQYAIEDENGNNYFFRGHRDYSRQIPPQAFGIYRGMMHADFYGYQWGVKSTWPLSLIETASGGRVDFNYQDELVEDHKFHISRWSIGIQPVDETETDGDVEYWKHSRFELGKETRKTSLLERIDIEQNDSTVEIFFYYGNKDKEKLRNWYRMGSMSSVPFDYSIPNTGKLDSIVIRDKASPRNDYQAKVIKKIVFKYTSSDGRGGLYNPVLLLDKVTVSGEGSYKFAYHDPTNFPIQGTTDIDRWGYYNGYNLYNENWDSYNVYPATTICS